MSDLEATHGKHISLLARTAVAQLVLPNHVLHRLRLDYPLVHLNLRRCQRTEHDLIDLLRQLSPKTYSVRIFRDAEASTVPGP